MPAACADEVDGYESFFGYETRAHEASLGTEWSKPRGRVYNSGCERSGLSL